MKVIRKLFVSLLFVLCLGVLDSDSGMKWHASLPEVQQAYAGSVCRWGFITCRGWPKAGCWSSSWSWSIACPGPCDVCN